MKKCLIYLAIVIVLLLIFSFAACSAEPLAEEDNLATYIAGDTVPERAIEKVPDSTVVEVPDIIVPEVEMGVFSYSGQIPGKASKIPTCKEGTPTYVHFDLVDANGQLWTRESPVTLESGLYVSQPDSLPYGTYSVIATVLLSETLEPIYALPDTSEPDFHVFADTILPINLTISETPNTVEGTALCYIPSELPVDGGFGPGLSVATLQTVIVTVTATKEGIVDYRNDGTPIMGQVGCIDIIQMNVDLLIVSERYTFGAGYTYPFVAPMDYDYLQFFSWNTDDNINYIQQYQFTRDDPYNPEEDRILLFDSCVSLFGKN